MAEPFSRTTGDPIGLPLSRNCTEPVGTAEPDCACTVTDSVVGAPVIADSGTPTSVAVATSTGAGSLTTTVWAAAVEPAKPVVPEYTAATEKEPAHRRCRHARLTAAVQGTGAPTSVPATENWTVPPVGTGDTATDRVTCWPVSAVEGAVTVMVVSSSGTTGTETVTFCACADELVNPAAPVNSAVTANEPAASNVCGRVAHPQSPRAETPPENRSP